VETNDPDASAYIAETPDESALELVGWSPRARRIKTDHGNRADPANGRGPEHPLHHRIFAVMLRGLRRATLAGP
jgi:hypothetical protein